MLPFVFARILLGIGFVCVLAACQPEKNAKQTNTAAENHPSQMASAVLNVAQGQDILHRSQPAAADITASDEASAAFQTEPMMGQKPASSESVRHVMPADLPSLPLSCQSYFARARSCFQKQNQGEALLAMLQQQQMDLAYDYPDDMACERLYRSFDGVAQNLACE